MTVIHLDHSSNFIDLDDEVFLVLRNGSNACHVVAGKCVHRGGPLHLGHVDETGRSIVCPWHKNKTNIARLVANELPAISVPGRVTVVINSETDEVPAAYRRKMLLDCSAAFAQLKGTK
jgi:hypothetical protein